MKVSVDPAKRDRCFQERGLALEDAAEVFAGFTLDADDTRRDYGERRTIHLRPPAGSAGLHRADAARPSAACDLDEVRQ